MSKSLYIVYRYRKKNFVFNGKVFFNNYNDLKYFNNMIINIEYLNDNNQLLGTYKVKLNTVSENTNADKWINAQVSRNNLLKGTFFDFNNKSWEIKNLWNKGYIIKLICDPMKCNKFRILMTFDNNKKFIFNWNNIFNFNNNLNKFESVIKHYSTDGYF